MDQENLKLVIVGHVDHGKSTLIGRLLADTDSLPEGKFAEIKAACEELGHEMEYAYIMDHLREEREQNVTIDTAQIFFKSGARDYVIIDAPGHVEFTKNMITGASQAEAAILIVDAKEGVAEQTKRHAYILGMLGIPQVIVAVNKMDDVDYDEKRFDDVKADIEAFLAGLGITPTYVLPISAREGDNIAGKSANMPWAKNMTILEALDTFTPAESHRDKPMRYPVQDVYKIDGKRILAGRVESGVLKEGQEVRFLPADKASKIKAIEVFGGEKTSAEAGESIGITISDPHFIERGEVAVPEGDAPAVRNTFRANLFWMSKQPLSTDERLTVKLATQEQLATVATIERRIDSASLEVLEEDAKELAENELGHVIIQTKNPLVIEDFNSIPELGRFVLERETDTVAGGIITDTGEAA